MLAAIVVVGLAVLMVAATPFVTGQHNAFAKSKTEVGNSTSIAIQAAKNSQHCAFGTDASLDTCTNTPTNTQSQTANVGGTGSG